MTELIIIKPDDMHLHLREGDVLKHVVKDTQKQFARAIVMPNLKNPIKTVHLAEIYYQEIKKNIEDLNFEPLMTLFFNDELNSDEIKKVSDSNIVHGIKLYPSGVTTNSKDGVDVIENCFKIFELMQKYDVPLLVHAESNDKNVDIFDREKVFIDRNLSQIHQEFPNLRIVVEHISSKEAAEFVIDSGDKVFATITPQHLLFDRNDLLSHGIKPHHYCLPILKRSEDRVAIVKAATSGSPKFFLGTDSAPHFRHEKESSCGCAGIYSALSAMELYASIFETENALDKLENFSSKYGADFYELPPNNLKIKLTKKDFRIPARIQVGNEEIIPLFADETLSWQLSEI
ncbi:MAG: dihydroorotase [Rhodobacteraceae bacterium]|nr:dihydroorotase [Paracoccaceae bacterium]MBC67274.1 dihydroorotase [Paracoccaceae bacterium]|tara:strand:- start:280 stop:1314 length:1035 start_codon:yes stop_codon:yes gene_type:complete